MGIIKSMPTTCRIENSEKYKLPLPRQIEIRMKKVFDYEKTIKNIHSTITNVTDLGRRNDKINVCNNNS